MGHFSPQHFFFQAEDGIRDAQESRGLGDVYKRQVNIIVKPTDSPTQGQPNPRKIRLKVAFRSFFPTANSFLWVGIDFV